MLKEFDKYLDKHLDEHLDEHLNLKAIKIFGLFTLIITFLYVCILIFILVGPFLIH